MYQRIPTAEEVNSAYMNIPEAATALGLQYPTEGYCRAAGLQIVRLCGKPMVYRHEVEAKVTRREAEANV